jgi:hypothetical protein
MLMNMWTDKRKKNDWRSCLTAEEEAELALIEKQMKTLVAKRYDLSKARQLIQNRATTRFRSRRTDA